MGPSPDIDGKHEGWSPNPTPNPTANPGGSVDADHLLAKAPLKRNLLQTELRRNLEQ